MRLLHYIVLLFLPLIGASCISDEAWNQISRDLVLTMNTWLEFSARAVEYRETNTRWPSDPHDVLTAADPGTADMQKFCDGVRLHSTERGLEVNSTMTGELLFLIDTKSTADHVEITNNKGMHATANHRPTTVSSH